MFRLKLIGCDPCRYQGAGFGNISYKVDSPTSLENKPSQFFFLISGTQTGHLENLSKEDLALVMEAYPQRNRLVAKGPVKPSSEALTHAAVYGADPDIRWVIHVHSAQIWRQTQSLSIPFIDSQIAYGTPEMAAAMTTLMATRRVGEETIFSMLGHEDGIISFGSTAEQAALPIIKYLALAQTLR